VHQGLSKIEAPPHPTAERAGPPVGDVCKLKHVEQLSGATLGLVASEAV
jgi:hypothetical protein